MSRQSIGVANEPQTLNERVVTLASATTVVLDPAVHANRVLIIGATSNAAYTAQMPHATGSGDVYHFYAPLTKGSGSIIVNLNHGVSSNAFLGSCMSQDSNGVWVTFAAAASDGFDRITLNGTTTGAADPGDYITLLDLATGVWQVLEMKVTTSGNQATPFSAP